MENIKTFCLMLGLVLLFMWVGSLIGGESGMRMAFLIALFMNFTAYFMSDKMVLKQYRAKEVDKDMAPQLYQIVARLAQKADLPMPKVYMIDEEVPNAFATGRNPKHAAVAVTKGLLNLMNENEVEGVLAHEMSHVKHYDILTSTIAAVFAGAIGMLAQTARYTTISNNGENQKRGLPILAVFLMPIAASFIRFSISRTREYEADAGAAKLTQHPEWLISALSKLEGYSQNYAMQNVTSTTAHMFIINPMAAFPKSFSTLFSTHPTTENRIARLKMLLPSFSKMR